MIQENKHDLLKKIQAVKYEYELHGKTHLPNYTSICQQERRIQKEVDAEIRRKHHRGDPHTSQKAAEKVVKSGELTRQQKEVYELWRKHPNTTAGELAGITGRDYYMIQRRKKELVDAKLIKETGEERDGQLVFKAKKGE